MRKANHLAIFIFIIFVSIININKISAANFGSVGSSNIGDFEICSGQYNGCIGTIGYRYRIISDFKYNESGVSYKSISGSYLNKEYVYTPTELDKNIKSGGALFNTILSGTGVSISTFFSEGYAILVEPYFKIMYDNSSEFTGVASDVAYHIQELVWYKGGFNKYTGFWSVNQLIPCTAYIPYSGSSSDSYCSEVATHDHKEDYLKIAYNNTRYGKWIIYARDIQQSKGKIEIKKTDYDTGAPIQGIKFYLKGTNKSCTTNSYGQCSITDVPYGTYTLVEDSTTAKAKGYSGSYSKTITINDQSPNVSISATNQKSCTIEFDLYKNNREERIRMYQYYRGKGFDYRNLLDFSITDASLACSKKETCSNNIEIGCLSAKTINNGFGKDNLSCYTEVVKVGTYTGYCGVTFSLGNNLEDLNDFKYLKNYSFPDTKSGQMIVNRDSNQKIIARGVINRECYVYGLPLASAQSLTPETSYTSYSNYIRSLYFNFDEGSKNDNKIETAITKFTTDENKVGWTRSSITGQTGTLFKINYYQDYSLKSVYSDIGTGKIHYENCDSKTNKCKFLGYGFASPLSTFGNNLNLYFSLTTITAIDSRKTIESSTCTYSVKNEIIDNPQDPNGDLNLEFRIIDTNDPFPGKKGNGRQVGENWCSIDLDIDKNGTINAIDAFYLISGINNNDTSKELDINRDGKVDKKDYDLFKIIIAEPKNQLGKDCSSDNNYINAIMKLTNNSYDKNNAGPIYTIELNSATIKEIKEYNKTHQYDDYNMECDTNGENCKSLFLEDFGIVRNQ